MARLGMFRDWARERMAKVSDWSCQRGAWLFVMNIPPLLNRGQKYFDFERQYVAGDHSFEILQSRATHIGVHFDGVAYFLLSSPGGGPNPINRDLLLFRGRWKSYTP